MKQMVCFVAISKTTNNVKAIVSRNYCHVQLSQQLHQNENYKQITKVTEHKESCRKKPLNP